MIHEQMINRRLLVIDDEENMCHMLKVMLERHGYEVQTETSAERALNRVEQQSFSFILCDVRMPGMDGLDFIRAAADKLRDCSVIMMSAYGSVESAIEAMKAGAYDFISKPFKTDEVLLSLKKAEEREQLKRENLRLKSEIDACRSTSLFEGMVGESAAIRRVFEMAKQVANYATTVLITGESGTGKELVARGIHHYSARNKKPFVAVNCGSIPENLLESELFGHEKGSFTGADKRQPGLFELAHGSTLFLDEIGELPLAMQVKLLRVLQEREVRPVGASFAKKIDVRLVAATARDLRALVRAQHFREDLFYRLNVVHISIPPLRERKEDIPLLCRHFINFFNTRFETTIKSATPATMSRFLEYEWPGNVRELENIVQRAMVLAGGDYLEEAFLPKAKGEPSVFGESAAGETLVDLSLKSAQKKLEIELITKALLVFEGNKSRAAKALEISYPSLLQKIKEYGI